MRWTIPVLFALFLVVPAGAEDPPDARAEYLKLTRAAVEAQLKIGDVLQQKGDLDGALRAYREALKLFETAVGKVGKPPADVPFTGPKRPPVPVVDRGPAVRRREPVARAQTSRAVELGLKWLADHQDLEADGRWDCDDFAKHDPPDDKSDGMGGALHDVGATGLATLAFLGAGYTDRGSERENRYAKNVRMGLRFLMTRQDTDGVFGTRASHSFIYNHAIATLAMCEAYSMTRNPRYKKPAQEGLNFIAKARNPYMAWRYEPRGGENDTSVTTWCVMALKAGKFAGLAVDPDAFEGARQWIEKMTDPRTGQVGYNYPGGSVARPEGLQDRFPTEKSQAMTAAGMLSRIFTGEDPRTSETIQKGARLCLATAPRWDPTGGSIDMYYWYFGTLALYQVGGEPWRQWNTAMKAAILDSQRPEGSGSRTGSWDPAGVWGVGNGGRIYSTALMTMCLEVYYRYERVFGTK